MSNRTYLFTNFSYFFLKNIFFHKNCFFYSVAWKQTRCCLEQNRTALRNFTYNVHSAGQTIPVCTDNTLTPSHTRPRSDIHTHVHSRVQSFQSHRPGHRRGQCSLEDNDILLSTNHTMSRPYRYTSVNNLRRTNPSDILNKQWREMDSLIVCSSQLKLIILVRKQRVCR